MTDTIVVRVYRVADGYELKLGDHRGASGSSSLEAIAEQAAFMVKKAHEEDAEGNVGIDFEPYHAIECPSGLGPSLCWPLTADERQDFWIAFRNDM